jgi:hypothetical protein
MRRRSSSCSNRQPVTATISDSADRYGDAATKLGSAMVPADTSTMKADSRARVPQNAVRNASRSPGTGKRGGETASVRISFGFGLVLFLRKGGV